MSTLLTTFLRSALPPSTTAFSGARSSDDAHDTFTKTFNFVQTKAALGKVLRVRASLHQRGNLKTETSRQFPEHQRSDAGSTRLVGGFGRSTRRA